MHDLQYVTVVTRGRGNGLVLTDGTMLLQRRASLPVVEFSHVIHKFWLCRYSDGAILLEFPGHPKLENRTYRPATLTDAEKIIQAETGDASLHFGKSILSYAYCGKGSAIEADDLFLSPIVYCPSTDTVRLMPSNICLAAFVNGHFREPQFEVDRAAEPYLFAVKDALRMGFHVTDLNDGDDFCKRRLSWLAGYYLLDAAAEETLRVAVLDRNMAAGARLSV